MLFKKITQISILSLSLTFASCSKGGMFGGKFGQIFGGGGGSGSVSSSAELEAFKYTAGFESTYADLFDKLNDQDQKICDSFDALMGAMGGSFMESLVADIMTDFDFSAGCSLTPETEASFRAKLKAKLGLDASASVEGTIAESKKEALARLATAYLDQAPPFNIDNEENLANQALMALIPGDPDSYSEAQLKNFIANSDAIYKFFLLNSLKLDTSIVVEQDGTVNLSGSLIEQLALKSKNQKEVTSYMQIELKLDPKYTDKITITTGEIDKILKLKVRREVLQIVTNALMARGVNVFSVLTFLGIRVVDNEDKSKTADASIQQLIEFVGLDKKSLRDLYFDEKNKKIDASKLLELFRGNKPHLYHAIENAFDENKMTKLSDNRFRHELSVTKMCEHMIKQSGEGSSDLTECKADLTLFIGNLAFIQDIEKKKIEIVFEKKNVEPLFLSDLKIIEIKYDFNYKFEIQFELENLKTYAAIILEKQLKAPGKESYNASNKLDQKDVDFLKNISLKGVIGLSDYIEIPDQYKAKEDTKTGIFSLADVTKTTLKSNLGISFNQNVEFLLPEKRDAADYYDAFFANASDKIEGDTDGDIRFSSAKADNIIGVMHRREAAENGNYDDSAYIKLAKTDFYFPPYLLTTNDFLNFDATVNQGCTDEKVASHECAYQFKLRKNLKDISQNETVTIRDFVNPAKYIDTVLTTSDLGVRGFIPVKASTSQGSVSEEQSINRALSGDMYHQKVYVKLDATLDDNRFLGEYLDPNHPLYTAPNPNGMSVGSIAGNYSQFQEGNLKFVMRSKEGLIEQGLVSRALTKDELNVSTNVTMRKPSGEMFVANYCNIGLFETVAPTTSTSESYLKYHSTPISDFITGIPSYNFTGASACSSVP